MILKYLSPGKAIIGWRKQKVWWFDSTNDDQTYDYVLRGQRYYNDNSSYMKDKYMNIMYDYAQGKLKYF
ncbi:MAG: hypothetical protein ACRCUM_00180 [Mycoplasmoidaceae bacterium]